MRAGDIVTVIPDQLVAGGNALARIDGFPVFAENVFPGDVARVRLYEVKKGFAKAELVELVTPGPNRRAAPCPIAAECGGCDWTALRLDRQLEAKRGILVESLRRIGRIDPASLPAITIHPSPLNYRLRSRFHSDGAREGFYAIRSNRVVPLASECEVVGPATADYVGAGARVPAETDVWETGGELVAGDEPLAIQAGRFRYELSAQSFFQVNRHLLGTMLALVEKLAGEVAGRGEAVDLYAGVGFFTLPLAGIFDSVVAIEGSQESVRWARKNAPKNVRVIAGPVEREVQRLHEPDFVFLDPPRAGTRSEVISVVGERTRERIAWLSCDPVTFARDASRLIASGWRLSTLDLLDLFPNTHHVETLSSFVREA
jgi:tRNA/tmRNA/rRNA uracil-C5-methylase (TrmA/RlmC/RlmD family)